MSNWNKYFRQLKKTKSTPRPSGAMTNARKRAYILERGATCPHCGSSSLTREQCDAWGKEPERVAIRTDCAECKRHWFECYSLNAIVEAAQ